MGLIDCRVEIPEVAGLDSGKLTVGRHTTLICNGEIPTDYELEKTQFKGENEIVLKIFSTEKTSNQLFRLDFTAYKAGELNLSEYKFFDGKTELSFSSPKLVVESVIKPTTDGQPSKPYGPIFPLPVQMDMAFGLLPKSYLLSIVLVILLFILAVIIKINRIRYYRKLKQKLSQFDSPTDPETQFYRSIRSAEKKSYPLSEVEEAFRLYIMRAYRLPLLELDNPRAIRYFKRNYPAHKAARLQLEKLFSDFEELKRQTETNNAVVRQDFIKRLYNYVDHFKGIES